MDAATGLSHLMTRLGAAHWRVRPGVSLGLIVLALCAAWPDAAASLAGQWIGSSTYHHAPAAAPLAAILIVYGSNAYSRPMAAPSALVLLACFGMTYVVGAALDAEIVMHTAIVGAFVAAAIAHFGWRNARAGAFGLAFLGFLIPFGASITPALQKITLAIALPMLTLTGVPARADGILIFTPIGDFRIAEACAGLNFTLAAMMVAGFIAGIAFRTWKKRAALLLGAAIAALMANAVRAAGVIWLANETSLGIAFARDHALFGLSVYAAFLCAFIVICRRYREGAPLFNETGRLLLASGDGPQAFAFFGSLALIAGSGALALGFN